jgi:4-amino-4-deoxy-L-arabinose transferase-like glycosyltransferase
LSPVRLGPGPHAGPASSLSRHSRQSSRGRSPETPLAAVVLLLVLFGQSVFGSLRLSLTVDEPIHIAMGYTWLSAGDPGQMPQHEPPLINQWSAWPLLLRPDVPDPRQVPEWDSSYPPHFATELLTLLGPIESVELATRVPVILVSLLLGAVVYRWASDLFGARAGVLALFLYVFDPNIIAHSQLATTDVGGLAFGVLATFLAWRVTRRATWSRVLLAGLALGLCVASKVSGLFYAPFIALLLGATVLISQRQGLLPGESRRWGLRLLVIYGFAFVTLWAVYRFEAGPVSGSILRVPFPSYVQVLRAFRNHLRSGHLAFLAGQVSRSGWWWYFPLAFALKTPLPTLLLLVPAVMAGLRWPSDSPTDEAWLLCIPLAHLSGSMLSTIDIGYRHLLPMLPFLFLYLSRLAVWFPRLGTHLLAQRAVRYGLRIICCAVLCWYAWGTARLYPHYLAFFNELAGGPAGGHRYLADSNTDWGQAFKELAAYQRAEGLDLVWLSALTHLDPAIYGVRYEPLSPMPAAEQEMFFPSYSPPPGDYVISATTLQGIGLSHPETYDWFRQRQPDAVIGHVLFLYHVAPLPPRTWVSVCAAGATPPAFRQLEIGFGLDRLVALPRFAVFDCTRGWLYPEGGASPGWVVVAGEPPEWTRRRLETLRLSYEQRYAGDSSPLRIYAEGGMPEYARGGSVHILPAGVIPSERGTALGLELPLAFDGGLTLLGLSLDKSVVRPGETTYLETSWRVDDVQERLFSFSVQLWSANGHTLAVDDGAVVSPETWQPGDVYVQRHAPAVPEDAPSGRAWLECTVGSVDTSDRWLARVGDSMGTRVLVASVEVR